MATNRASRIIRVDDAYGFAGRPIQRRRIPFPAQSRLGALDRAPLPLLHKPTADAALALATGVPGHGNDDSIQRTASRAHCASDEAFIVLLTVHQDRNAASTVLASGLTPRQMAKA